MNYSETISLIERYKTANRELCDVDGSGQNTHYAVCTGYFSALASNMLADLPEKRRPLSQQLDEGLLPGAASGTEGLRIGEVAAVPRKSGPRQGIAHRVPDRQSPRGDRLDDLGAELAKLDK